MNAIEKIGLMMQAKALVKQIQSLSPEEALDVILDASHQVADYAYKQGVDVTRAQIIKFIAEDKSDRTLAVEIALMEPVERKF